MAKAQRKTFDEKVYAKERRTAARWTHAQMEEMERALNTPENHFWRRFAFGVQAMSGKALFTMIETDREAAVDFADAAVEISKYLAAHQNTLDFIGAAQMRIIMALAGREDISDVFDEAKKAAA